MSSYVPLFLALVKRKGYNCVISEPQLVNGSATPPPSRRYPGLVCYMVTITVNKVEYHGYGPTAGLARQFAAFEAYKALASVLKKDVPRPVQDSRVECAQDDDSASVSMVPDDISSVCSEPSMNDCTGCTSLLSLSADEDGDSTYREEQETLAPANQESEEVFTTELPESAGEMNHKKWLPKRDSTQANNVQPHDRQHSEGLVATDGMPTHDGLGRIRENPVGQLQEVFAKEFKIWPVFAESTQVSGPGGIVEFVCTVEVNDLSARGIGQSKKLARRHAAENMLALMIDRGINVNPSKKYRGNKKSNPSKRGWTEQRRNTPFQQSYGQSCSKWNNYNRFKRWNSFPSDSQNAHHQRFHQVNPQRRGLLPLPFLPPLRVPEPVTVYKNVTDSESDTDCENDTIVSTGLCEVLPPNLQNKDMQCLEIIRPQSSSSPLTDRGECTNTGSSATAPLGMTNFASGGKQSISAQSLSADIPPTDGFSDIASPFPAHSDPFQFTVRLPRIAESSLIGAPPLIKSPPWKELRCNSQLVPPSTDHIYHNTSAPSRHGNAIEKSADAARPAKDQQPLASQAWVVLCIIM